MYDICHPSYYKIVELGCKDELKNVTAFHIYIELCEGRRLWDVEYRYNSQLDLIYLTAKKKEAAPTEIYIPWASRNNIKLCDIEDIHKQLNCTNFTLAVRNGEGTNIFYEATQGMKKPLGLQEVGENRKMFRQKLALEREIKRNSRNLYELAKSSDEEKKITPNNPNMNDQAAPL